MELLNEFLIQYGYAGMCIAAFLAGSFVPFNSEVVMAALLAASDMNPWLTVIWGTVGNVAGAMFNYYIGRLGDPDSIAKRIHLKKSGVERVNPRRHASKARHSTTCRTTTTPSSN